MSGSDSQREHHRGSWNARNLLSVSLHVPVGAVSHAPFSRDSCVHETRPKSVILSASLHASQYSLSREYAHVLCWIELCGWHRLLLLGLLRRTIESELPGDGTLVEGCLLLRYDPAIYKELAWVHDSCCLQLVHQLLLLEYGNYVLRSCSSIIYSRDHLILAIWRLWIRLG